MLAVPLGGAKQRESLVRAGRQQLLRERRAIVGAVRLAADDPHRTFIAAATQRLGAALRRQPAADDEHASVLH